MLTHIQFVLLVQVKHVMTIDWNSRKGTVRINNNIQWFYISNSSAIYSVYNGAIYSTGCKYQSIFCERNYV